MPFFVASRVACFDVPPVSLVYKALQRVRSTHTALAAAQLGVGPAPAGLLRPAGLWKAFHGQPFMDNRDQRRESSSHVLHGVGATCSSGTSPDAPRPPAGRLLPGPGALRRVMCEICRVLAGCVGECSAPSELAAPGNAVTDIGTLGAAFEILQVDCAGYDAEPPWIGDPSCIRSTTGPTVQPRVCRAERPRFFCVRVALLHVKRGSQRM